VSDKPEAAEFFCKDLMRQHIGEISAVMQDMRATYASLRAMEEDTGIPRSKLHHVAKRHEKYKNNGFSEKTLRRLKQLTAARTPLSDKLRELLCRYIANKRGGLYSLK
jgi:hypothetical protein